MKSSQEQQQQPGSMEPGLVDSSSSSTSEYAYRPLTTKHRRAGSTGTTGDEEYTTDEDELYGDEADCAGPAQPILKSDLARAATDLFGYAKHEDTSQEPTSLFDEDDVKYRRDSSPKPLSIFAYNELSRVGPVLARRRSSASSDSNSKPRAQQQNGQLDRRLSEDKPEAGDGAKQLEHTAKNAKSSSEAGPRGDEETTEAVIAGSESSSEPPSPCTVQWGRAVAEAKEQAIAKLQEELQRAHEELKLKDEEVARLTRIRQDVEAELEELTASLFQEAHNMVREANQRQATAERLLEESRMKSEVLAAEVAALKTLVLTSTPARPNPHLHPQIACNGSAGHDEHHSANGIFAKKHRRSPSHFNLKYGRESSPPDSPLREQRSSLPCEPDDRDSDKETDRDREKKRERYLISQLIVSEREQRDKDSRELGLEVEPRVHGEFLRWKANPCVDKSEPFVERIFREDIDLCLDFPNAELGARVRQAVLDGIIFVEAVSDKAKLGFPKKCALLEAPRQCHYRMRMGDQENQWHSISQICRNRIIAVCDFLNYLRYIERGLVKSSVHDVFWEITRLRKEMVLARLGLPLSS